MMGRTNSRFHLQFMQTLRPSSSQRENLNPTRKKSYTKEINQHIPSGFCVYNNFAYGEVENPLKLYRGKDCVKVFCDYIKNEVRRLHHIFPKKPMKPLTSEEWKEYGKAKKCHVCFKSFEELNPKVRDHCHYTGQYRGPAHRN